MACSYCLSNRLKGCQWPFSSFDSEPRPCSFCSLWPFSNKCTMPSPVSPNGDHIGKPNPPVQMRNDIWRSPLSLRWRLLLLLVSSLCIAAVEKAGENDENNKPDETSNKKRARDRCIRHLWRALPSADCLPVSTCAAFLPSWALRAP